MLRITGLLGKRVMIAAADENERERLVNYLYEQGCRVYTASNGREALYRMSLVRPELCLLDMHMPICDGLQTCKLMQINVETKEIPIIFMDACGHSQDRINGLLYGALDYIVKPFDLDEVGLRLAVHLRGRGEKPAFQTEMETAASGAEAEPEQDLAQHVKNLDNVIYSLARQYLLKSLNRTPRLQELADVVGTNTRRLNDAFRRITGSTALEFLRVERMKEARMLLENTHIGINEIAAELGFSSGGNFSTAFKERYGVSPKIFRSATTE